MLATEATAMLHGREAAEAAAETAQRDLCRRRRRRGFADADVSATASNIAQALTALGFTPSNGEAKRKIAEGAVRLDDEVGQRPAGWSSKFESEPVKLSLGQKKHGLLVALA